MMKSIFRKLYRRTVSLLRWSNSPITDLTPSAGLGNFLLDDLILCNFCGSVFRRSGPDHSEFLACPYCGAIARERVAYQAILHEMYQRTRTLSIFFGGANELRHIQMLECSPRFNPNRRKIYEQTLGKYLSSDFDMSAHCADIRMDLTSEQDVAPFENAFDIILCSHILEHIPDYRIALRHLHQMLTPEGFVVLQVPLLENRYTPVTWDEFHGDNTRVYHRFSFDLLAEIEVVFRRAVPVVGLLDFEITSPEIKPDKYQSLQPFNDRCIIFGEKVVRLFGLGIPDLCDAFTAYR
jgi:predicted SAM-dependent methyltransferase